MCQFLYGKYVLPGAGFTALLLCLCFITPAALSQSIENPEHLIFEPVVLDPETGKESVQPYIPLQLLPLQTVLQAPINPAAPVDVNPLEVQETISQYQDVLLQLESANGPFSLDLYQTLLDLGSQHQLMGDHEAAIEIFQRAEYISRINNGLVHPEQFASIEKMIESYMAIGDVASANEKQRYIVFLSEQHYGQTDLSTLPSLLSLAEQNMINFNRVLTMPVVPTMSITSGFNGFGRSRSPTQKQLAFRSLMMAQQNYYQAISTMIDNREFFDPMLLELEYRLLETLLLQAYRSSILEDSDFYLSVRRFSTGSLIKRSFNQRYSPGFTYGKNAFERILIYLSNNSEAKVYQLVNALMEYGDWNMLFGRSNSAHKKYQEAYEVFEDLDLDQETIDQFFRPALPVHLPLITAKPNSRKKFGIPDDEELEYQGHIDIAFTISRFGKAKQFDILGRSENVDKAIERRLQRYIRNSPFRPLLHEDGTFKAQRVTLRYYFAYADQVI